MPIRPSDAADPAPRDPLRSIASQLSSPHADMGRLAALRRFDPRTESRYCLFETQQTLLAAGIDLPADDESQPRWALIVHCLALARGAHDSRRNTGAALFDLNYSDARLRQLVEADAPMLFDLLPALARRLAASGAALDWWPLAELALAVDRDEQRAQQASLRIVQGFLRAQAAQPVS